MSVDPAIVHIVDDDQAARDSMVAFVSAKGLPCRAFASSEEFLNAEIPDTPGCMLLDVRMPGLSGLDLQKDLARRNSALSIIVVSGFVDVPAAVEAMRGGAIDIVQKPSSESRLWEAIQRGLAKSREIHAARQRVRDVHLRIERLTEDELAVMDLLVQGESNKAIAMRLGIGLRTAESRRSRLFEKIGCDSAHALTAIILRLERDEEIANIPPPHTRRAGARGAPKAARAKREVNTRGGALDHEA